MYATHTHRKIKNIGKSLIHIFTQFLSMLLCYFLIKMGSALYKTGKYATLLWTESGKLGG